MTFYLSSPGSQMHTDHLKGMPVLLSYAIYARWVDDYVASFGRVLIDSGAFSEFNSGAVVDGPAYLDRRTWTGRRGGRARPMWTRLRAWTTSGATGAARCETTSGTAGSRRCTRATRPNCWPT